MKSPLTEPTATSSKQSPWPSILLIILVGVITAGQIFKLAFALPFVGNDLQLSLVQRGWLFSIISAIAATSGFLAGSVADHFGMRRSLISGLLIIALTSLLGAFADTFSIAISLRLLEGFGVLAVITSAPSLIMSLAPDNKRGLALAAWTTYMPLGAMLASLIGGWGIEEFGWNNIWLICAGLSLICAFLIQKIIPAKIKSRQTPAVSDILTRLRLTLKSPAPLLLCLAMFSFTIMHGPFVAWLPSFLIEQRSIDVNSAAQLTAFIVVFNVIGNLGAGFLLNHGYHHWQVIIAAGLAMFISGLIFLADFSSDILQLIAALTFSALSGLVPGTVFASIPVYTYSPMTTGTLNGLIVQGAQLGQVLGPPLFAWFIFQAHGNWSIGSWYYGGFSLAVIIFGLLLHRCHLNSEV